MWMDGWVDIFMEDDKWQRLEKVELHQFWPQNVKVVTISFWLSIGNRFNM